MSRESIAKDLVDHHTTTNTELTKVLWYARDGGDREDDPLKLLEVNPDTVPAGILPIYFGKSHDVGLPVVIIEVTAEEYAMVEAGELSLPESWDSATVLHPAA